LRNGAPHRRAVSGRPGAFARARRARVETAMPDRRVNNRAPALVAENIDAILRAEEDTLERRSLADAIMEQIGGSVGTMWFVLAHLVAVVCWLAINLGLLGAGPVFDPYPFNFLSTIASIEALLLVAFVLRKENRMSALADRRTHLDLQVNLLTERETSKVIQLLLKLCEKHGIQQEARDPEARELAQTTRVGHVLDELGKRLPEA
jgi:uncharacterized membrane protein